MIRFSTDETNAYIEVVDNGAGRIDENFDIQDQSGHGLKNIYNRLSLLFGNQFSIKLEPIPIGGVKAAVTWPILKKE
jgi:signal transduction histidine kinase